MEVDVRLPKPTKRAMGTGGEDGWMVWMCSAYIMCLYKIVLRYNMMVSEYTQ